jgi:hypothetical protein
MALPAFSPDGHALAFGPQGPAAGIYADGAIEIVAANLFGCGTT